MEEVKNIESQEEEFEFEFDSSVEGFLMSGDVCSTNVI